MHGCQSRPLIAPLQSSQPYTLAMYNDRAITLQDLAPALLDRAGAAALAAAVLDKELASRSRLPTQAEMAYERNRPAFALSVVSATSDEASRQMRHARLRQLVAPTVTVADEEIDLALRIRTGPRDRVRVIVLPTRRDASDLRLRLLAASIDGSVPEAAIIDAAIEESIDAGASLGGLIPALSPFDPGVPTVIRDAASRLEAGQLSQALALERGAALVWMGTPVSTTPARVPTRQELARDIRRRKENIAMQQLAVDLLRDAQIDVLAPEIAPGWNQIIR
jgi:hypothetical protein